jgi:hypothetical protein
MPDLNNDHDDDVPLWFRRLNDVLTLSGTRAGGA